MFELGRLACGWLNNFLDFIFVLIVLAFSVFSLVPTSLLLLAPFELTSLLLLICTELFIFFPWTTSSWNKIPPHPLLLKPDTSNSSTFTFAPAPTFLHLNLDSPLHPTPPQLTIQLSLLLTDAFYFEKVPYILYPLCVSLYPVVTPPMSCSWAFLCPLLVRWSCGIPQWGRRGECTIRQIRTGSHLRVALPS